MIKIRIKLLAAFFFGIIILALSSFYAVLYGEHLASTINTTTANNKAVKDIVFDYNNINNILIVYSFADEDKLPALDHEYEFSIENIRIAIENLHKQTNVVAEVSSIEKMYEETKVTSEKIFKLHKEEKNRENDFAGVITRLSGKRYELRDSVLSGSLDLKINIAQMGYEDKEYNFQYQDKKHSLEWLASIEAVRVQLKKEDFSKHLPLIDSYLEMAKNAIAERTAINNLKTQQQFLVTKERNNFVENNIILTKINNINEKELAGVLNTGKNQKAVSVIFIFASFALGSLIVFSVSKTINNSVENLVNVAKKVSVGNLSQRANVSSGDELEYLGNVFNKMLDSIEKASQKMKEEQGEMKAVVSSIGEGLFALDMDFKVVLINKTAEKLLGASMKNMAGKHVTKMLTVFKGKRELPQEEWPSAKMLKTGEVVNIGIADDIYYKPVSGKAFPVEITTAPFIRNGLKGVIVIFKDITELKSREEDGEYSRKNLENALKSIYIERDNVQEEKNKLTAILDSIGEAVLAVDENKKVIIFNQVAEKITGFTFSELKDKKYDNYLKFLCESEERDKTDFIDILPSGKINCVNNNISLLAKEKHIISVDITATPIKDHEGEDMGHIVVFRDVTEKRETERMRSDFISLVSHQLRTPLASMKWFLEILLGGDVGKLKPKQADVVKETYDNNQNMIDFINQMLNVSRIESNRLAIVPASLNVNETVKEIINEIMPLLSGKKQKLKFTGLKEKALEIKTDKNLLRNIVNSLVTNASRYTPDGGKIAVEITKGEKGLLLFKVSDNGIGIPKKEQVKIFKKFSRASNAIVYEANGTGLGLYIVKSILSMMGGKIWFESKEGQGSTFFFLLPINSVFCEIIKCPYQKSCLTKTA